MNTVAEWIKKAIGLLGKGEPPNRRGGAARTHLGLVHRFTKQPKRIHQKIGYGYLLSIGIGLAGTATGLVVADYYQGKGVEQLFDAQIQTQIFRDFERATKDIQLAGTAVLQTDAGDETRGGGDRLIALETQLEKAETAVQEACQHIDAFLAGDLSWVAQDTEHYAALQDLVNGEPDWLADDAETLAQFFQTYEGTIEQYVGAVYRVLDARHDQTQAQSDMQTDSGREGNLSNRNEAADVQGAIATINALNDDLHTLNASLNGFLQTAQDQELEAAAEMEASQGLEKFIIIGSILASVTVAGIFAWQATRAIAQPIETITQVARRAAMELDYRLRVPELPDDEIGTLGRSINQLIESVEHQTAALEDAALTAETNAWKLQEALEKLQKTQMQLIQTEKMSSLGQLVAGIAHEINNPVSFIYGNITYAKQYIQDLLMLLSRYQAEHSSPSAELQEAIGEVELEFVRRDLPQLIHSIEIGAERIKSLVLSMRIFSRLNEADIKPIDVHQGIDSTLIILGHRLKEQPDRQEIRVIKNYGDLPPIECYAGQLNQVFMNILANAIDALDTAREISKGNSQDYPFATPDFLRSDSWEPTIEIRTQCLPDDQVEIKISNNGPPILPTVQERLFDPFFTTKPVGQGTGLGMSISYDIIVAKHDGKLFCESPPNQGVHFTIQLPLTISHTASATV